MRDGSAQGWIPASQAGTLAPPLRPTVCSTL